MEKNAKIYIAGHAGLLGSALKRILEQNGYKNLIFKTSKELDLRDQEITEKFFRDEMPEYVFLAAARVGGIIANKEKKAEFIYDNLQIQNNVIHLSYKYKVKKLIFYGSNCMYPKESLQPIKEEYLLTGSLEPTNEAFAVAKIAGVKMCQSYNEQYGTNFICAISANLFGPGDSFDPLDSHLISALIRKFHEGKIKRYDEVKLWGTGKPRREIFYVDELVDASLFLMNNYNSSEIINVGSGVDYEVKEIAEIVKSIVGYNGKISFDKNKPDGVMRKLLDVEKINSLGWKNKSDFKESLKKTYEWFILNHNKL